MVAHLAMLKALIIRDIQIKYAQSFLGIIWALVQPLTALLVYSIFFRFVFQFESLGYNYALYVFSGVLPWQLFSHALHHGSGSLIQHQDLVRKVAFPKLLLPLTKVAVGLLEMSLGMGILLIFLGISGHISVQLIALPVAILTLVLVSLALPVWISQLAIRRRDLLHILPYLGNFGIWLTPVFFTMSSLPNWLQTIVLLNPMTGVILLFRFALFGDPIPALIWWPLAITGVLLLLGLYRFKSFDKEMTDHL
ncbi:ABC transporter permease [Marinoscillum furvescens]|nr:ABC transporter permease [Marinoscillum furvescens]